MLLPTVSTTTNPVWLLLGSELDETDISMREFAVCGTRDRVTTIWQWPFGSGFVGIDRASSTIQNTSFSH